MAGLFRTLAARVARAPTMQFAAVRTACHNHGVPATTLVARPAPDIDTGAVINGEITRWKLADLRNKKWCVLLFYPKDFTYVCPTELIAFNDAAKDFEAVGAQVVAISTDTEECHLAWTKVPRKDGGLGQFQIPLLADVTKEISQDYGVLLPAGIALRGLFLINPEGLVDQATVNNLPVGRSVEETLRLIKAFQYVRKHGEVCPANWKPGQKTMVADPEKSKAYFNAVN
eukprot:m.226763 g.226763  ORF g.226763 m.226763 type:complete len:229 (-) comp11476_c0_seq1:33-719(-)